MRAFLLLFLFLWTMGMGVSSAQDNAVDVPFNGIVLDMTGGPVKGAHIYVKDPKRYALSNKKGHFGLMNVQADDTLKVEFRKDIYYIPVDGRRSIRIRLADKLSYEAEESQELVDVGYGFVTRREHTGVSNGISGAELRRTGEYSILQALRGKVPGLNVTPSIRPGDEGTVSMRGINSFYCDQTPLFVVDGIVVSTLDFVNINDVDYVEILKEASIYGSRGANGAILVHTKKGNEK